MLSKSDLVKNVADEIGISQAKANQAVTRLLGTITDALSRGEEVRLTGFGTFRVSQRAERKGRNPRTGEVITVPARRRASFSPSSSLNEAIQGGR